MKKRLLALLGIATGVLAGSDVQRRQIGLRVVCVVVKVDDGTMVTNAEGSVEADTMKAQARDTLSKDKKSSKTSSE